MDANGELIGYKNVNGTNTRYGLVDFAAVEADISDNIDRYGLQLIGKDVIRIQAPKISVATGSGTGTFGATGTQKFIIDIQNVGDDQIQWTQKNFRFINGFMVTQIT